MSDLQVEPGASDLRKDARIAHYRIVSEIGSGGMGKVYEAVDTRLDRPVAIKVLRPELLRDRDKVRRFRLEAKAASSLVHPAIVTVLDVGETRDDRTGGTLDFIVMEYVDGESLREKIRQRSPLNKRLDLVARIADGMAAAHAAGVIHRDLKPDNILVTADGEPKIVDFGLAKLIQPEILTTPGDAAAETVTLHASREGMVLGTVGYMSPEQVEGRDADHRSDIFSLGCILYEVISGQRAFASDSAVGTLHRILEEDPQPLRDRDPSLPAALEHIVRRCLAKDREERYQSIKEIAIELRSLLNSAASEKSGARPRRWRGWTLAAGAVLAALALLAAMVRPLLTRGPDLSQYKFTPLATDAAYEGVPAWSPDGRAIAYVRDVDGTLQIFVRSLDSPMAAQVTQSARDCREPFWHPRGDRIFYISQAGEGDALWSVGTGGGSPEVILANVSTADISPDGKTLVLLRQTGHGNFRLTLWISSPPGAEPRLYTPGTVAKRTLAPSAVSQYTIGTSVRFSPDGSKVGLWGEHHYGGPAGGTGRAERSVETVFWMLRYPDGDPFRVPVGGGAAALSFRFSWMPDSRHVLFGGELPEREGSHLWLMDTERGKIRPLTAGHGSESDPAIAPDGRRIVFSSERGDYDLFSIDLSRGTFGAYLATTRLERSPVSSRVRGEIAYVTNRSGRHEVWLRSEDGAWDRPIVSDKDFGGDATLLLANPSFSPDGQRVAYQRRGSSGYHVWISPIAGGPAVRLLADLGYQDSPTWSPDGNWIAFVAVSGSGFALHKIKVGAASRAVSVKEGIVYPSTPQWSPRGDWITVETPDGFAVTSSDGLKTRTLLEETVLAHTWSGDGTAIYAIRLSEDLHLLLSRLDVATGQQTELADLGLSPPVIDPVAGLTLSRDNNRLLMGIRRLEGDLWLLEGFSDRPVFFRSLRRSARGE